MSVPGVADRAERTRLDRGRGDGVWKDVGVRVTRDRARERAAGAGEGGGADRVGARADSRVGESNRTRGRQIRGVERDQARVRYRWRPKRSANKSVEIRRERDLRRDAGPPD